jgi:hypothetical protein
MIARHGFSVGSVIGLPKAVWSNYKQASALAMQVDFHRIYLRKIADAETGDQRRLAEVAHRHFLVGLSTARGMRPSRESREKVVTELDDWAIDHADLLTDPSKMPPDLKVRPPDVADIAWLLDRITDAGADARRPADEFFQAVLAMDEKVMASPLANDVEHMAALDQIRALIPKFKFVLDYLRETPPALAAQVRGNSSDGHNLLESAEDALRLSGRGELALLAVQNEMRRLFDEPYVASLLSADIDSPWGSPEVERAWRDLEEGALFDLRDELAGGADRCEQWVNLLGLSRSAYAVERIDADAAIPALSHQASKEVKPASRELSAGE